MMISLWATLPAMCLGFSQLPAVVHRSSTRNVPQKTISTVLRHSRDDTPPDDETDSFQNLIRDRIRENARRSPGVATATSSAQNVLMPPSSHLMDLASPPPVVFPERVHIVVFPSHQGAHTVEFPKGSGNNVLLAFASEQACRNFARSLQKQNFFDPTVRCQKMQDKVYYGLDNRILF
jgi:Protein of unknown function (DUF3110)